MAKPRGGHRQNAGALVQSVELSKEDWRTLRTILLARYGKADKETVNTFFAGVIRQEWQAYDEMIQAQAEMLSTKEIRQMNMKEYIKSKLIEVYGYTDGEANAANIYKGHGMEGYGWYVTPFGKTPWYIGANMAEISAHTDDDRTAREAMGYYTT